MWTLIDGFIDLGIALESRYLDGMGNGLMNAERSDLDARTGPTVTHTRMVH